MPESKILAAGPVVGGPATIPYRVVLRCFYNDVGMPKEFVVHNQQFNHDGSHLSFSDGSYFPARSYGVMAATTIMGAYEDAFKEWQERCAKRCLGLSYDCIFELKEKV
jgi:hypothetical protein